ncbi:Protein-methionine sulfoxide oxidase Mical [Melipona quadrifasciata]|uniref:F-actin monooxygenase n=1 Tax=Melipona quadrifasciata TaxID=166423 RepID=A0A0M8ZY01_9HYME|nr:Protein-methionine sulfoxide oxidase Mical [Melipona quadrifasciata]
MEHQQSRKQTMNSTEVAKANEEFDLFCNATTLKSILGHFRHLCELLKVRSNTINQFYPKLKLKLRSWKAQALWKKFDQRANHKCYNRGKACLNTRVLIIGGGPCGLRSAIEAQLLGAKVVVVEKRDRMSRNNVLHLWPFVIQDLRGLGAKKFFGKFCAGSIDHISIRQLQCILLKVALILGVEFHENVSFDSLIPPPENQEEGSLKLMETKIGWRAKTTPADHPVSQYEFDVLIGADGKRNTLEGFKRKEFRGKLAIAITANFINKRTEAEARVEEISGVAFIFNQKFFKELYQETGIDLENIVYYKDDTHYFVMTAKKHSLIDKGVILQDYADTAKLLAKENVDREALMLYAREAAEFSTEYQMIGMEFAVNHYGQPDVAMFDFTSMYAAENASRILERRGHRLLMSLVGDSLLEPFWPTGSGCARGFLSSLDACWAIKSWGANVSPLEVIAERESIYRLLGQTTPENLNRDYAAYTLDPHTRYPNLNVSSVTPIQVRSLLDTDDPDSIKQPSVQSDIDIPKKRRRRDLRGDSQVHPDTLLRWLQKQVAVYDSVQIKDMGASFKNGLAICAIIHRYRPNLIDFHNLNPDDAVTNNQLAFDVLEKELGIPPIMTGEEMVQCDVPDKLAMFSYLTQIYEVFRGEIPYIKHPKLVEHLPPEHSLTSKIHPHPRTPDPTSQWNRSPSFIVYDQSAESLSHSNFVTFSQQTVIGQDSATRTRHSRSRHNENLNPADKKGDTISRRSRKRRSTEKMGATVEERQKRLAEIEKNRAERMRKRQYLRNMATQQFYKSMQMLQANAKREKDEPFEDYSIFLYRQTAPDFKDRVKYLEQKILYPVSWKDREPKIHAGHHRNSIDEEFSGRIKSIEDKLKGSTTTEKKPRDLLRAIGKIEKTDWNVKEIEKKIEENKMGRSVRHDKVERVPKWSREQVGMRMMKQYPLINVFQMCICFIQFLARQIKMEKKGRDQKETDSKYADIDNTLKNIDRKIKEGNVLGYNKVSAMAEQFSNKSQDAEPKVHKSNVKPTITLPAQGGSEMCHFCNKRVYLMERLTAEGKFFHRGCFRCEYCSTSLRIGNHTFDRDKNGGRFYCTQHFGFSGTLKARAEKKRITTLNKENIPTTPVHLKTPEKAKIPLEGVVGLDLLDRGQTPERIEFENLAGISDAEEPQSQMDEDEWTDRNFGASTAEMGSSDDISDMRQVIFFFDSDDDNEVYEEAIDQPLTTEGTLELAKNWTLRYSHPHAAMGQSDTGSNEYEDSSDEYTNEDDESTTATEDEDDIRARELRKQEVWLKNPTRSSDTDTGSETEVKISQDSIDSITQESLTLPAQTPNLISPQEINVNNSELDQDVVSTEDIQKSSNKETMTIGTLVGNTDHQVTNDTKFDSEENTSQNTASGNLICSLDSSCNLVVDNRESNTVNSDSSLIVSNPIEQNNSNKHNSVDECISEYESLIDESCLLDLDRNQQIQNKSENDQVSFKFIDIGNNDVNDEVISVRENVDKIRNVENSELIQTVLSDHNEINNEVMPGPDITPETPGTPEITSTSNTKLQTVFAGIMLPDAIPFSQASYDNTVQPNIEEVVCLKEKLPDLITSSPNSSRDSSPSSSCEMYKSTEILYDELLMFDTEDKTAESCDSDSPAQNYKRSTGDIPKDNKLKLFIKDSKIPIVTITSPSPTSEKSLEETSVESAKLTIPKGTSSQAIQFDGNSSFDKLKRDLRQRKARNKMSVGELRPLTTENARRKIDKYFIDEKKQKAKNQNTQIQDEKSLDVKVVELDIKPKLSAKVEVKDIMKYFQKINPESSEKLNYERPESPKGKDCTNIDELNEIDVDAVVKEFEEIERQNEEIFSIDTEDIESQLHLNALLTELHLEDTNEQLNAKDINVIEECKLSSKSHEEKQNVTIDSPENITNSEQTQLSSQQINNILNTKSHENINPHNNAINEEQKMSTSPLINDTLENTIGCHEIQKTNTKQTILQPNSYTLRPELDGGKTEVTTNLHVEQITSQLDNEIKFREGETNKQLGSENVQQAISIPCLDYNILGIKLYEQKMQNTTHSEENIKTDVKQIISTPQFNNVKNNKYDVAHRSDNTLNTREKVTRNEALYKSSSELRSLPVGHDQVTKVKIVEQNIEIPKHVNKMNVHSNLILSNTAEVPKRPERKHVHHELSSSIRPNVSIVQFAPDIPVRRKSSKQKSNVPYSLEESTYNVQLSSTAINKRLVESDISTNNSNTINTETNKLKHSTKTTKSNSEISKATNTLENTVEHSHLTKSPPLINSDQRDSTKSIPSKNDRTKKDKCVASNEGTSEESEENSATEISTDSEFEHDGTTPTQHEIPEITINDTYVRKTRGNYVEPKKVQVKSKVISSINGNLKQDKDVDVRSQLKADHNTNPHFEKECKLNLLGFNNTNVAPLINPRKGDYLLNRTHSTEGIASKLSLELKKKYLLGGTAFGGSVMKSGSASNVDTQLRNFSDAISQHQKLLNPAPEPSPTMQAFLQGTSKLRSSNTQLSPISPTAVFSSSPIKPYIANRSSQNLLNNDNPIYKATILPEISKTHLPDLVKESSILKSKTTPNIVCSESKDVESKELTKEQMASSQLHAVKGSQMLENVRNAQITESNFTANTDENNGFRPRSPLHETSIIVPQVDWSKNKQKEKDGSTGDSEIDSDSLSSGDGEEAEEEAQNQPPVIVNLSPPRLQIHSTDGDLLLDEEANKFKDFDDGQSFEPDSIEYSYLREKELNGKVNTAISTPISSVNKASMELELIKNEIEQLELQDEGKKSISNCSTPTSITSAISNKHDDSEENDITTAALTETEFSEWARDGEVLVSDDLRDVEFNINPEFITTRRKPTLSDASKTGYTSIMIAKQEDLTDMDLDSSKFDKQIDVPVNNTSKLLANGENIDFMDTDNESLLDDSLQDASNTVMLKNRGYIEFVNIKSTPMFTGSRNQLIADAPIAKLEVENDSCSEEEVYNDKNVIEINPITMDDVMNKLNDAINKSDNDATSNIETKSNSVQEDQSIVETVNKELFQSMEEDSLLIVEPAEDTTTSEVVTILASPVNPQVSIVPNQVQKEPEQQEEETKITADSSNPDYLEYVKRLQSRIAEFSNAKDSIDIRKSKRKNSKSSLQSRTAEMIAEEIKNQEITINNSFNSPATSRKLEEITRERSKQKNVIQDLLMDKVEAHKQKSAEKKARRAARASSFNSTPTLSPIRPPIPNVSLINKFMPTSITTPENSPLRTETKKSVENETSYETQQPWKSEIEKSTNEESNETDVHDEDLGLSPEDKIKELRMKVARRQLSMEERKSKEDMHEPRLRHYNSGANKTGLKLQTSKSTDNMKAVAEAINFAGLSTVNAKSMDELLHSDSPKSNSSVAVVKRDKKQKTKDPERRKSIIQAVSDFFFKKESSSSPSNQKDKLSMFRLTSKTKGKTNARPKSVCEGMLTRNFLNENPPPIPPPPLIYTIPTTQVSDDSLSDDDTKTTAVSTSCMHKATVTEGSCNSISRKIKTTKRIARQARLKRLRMAQEIQRKLEETEVKQRELESRGVSVEKALRGEGECSDREEADLLREWFDLMKERTELRRYEKELLVRAQEVQLEDRHERLQQELRERLADDDDKKTSADVKKEGEILTEMLEIVAKRDSLIALLEEERQRYQDEDRDLEAQMLAKGLRLTPIKKCGPKYSWGKGVTSDYELQLATQQMKA